MTTREKSDVVKRFLLYLLICFPIILGINFLLEGKVDYFLSLFIDIVVGGAVIFLLEVLYRKRQEKIEKIKENVRLQNTNIKKATKLNARRDKK